MKSQAAAERSEGNASTVLVVDDDAGIREVITACLKSYGYSVESAPHGLAALSYLEHETPSVILLDMLMPVMDGWTFAQALREGGVSVPIVVMTASQDAAQRARALEVFDILVKPFELPTLLAAVRGALARGQ